jgi:hypothetical protein
MSRCQMRDAPIQAFLGVCTFVRPLVGERHIQVCWRGRICKAPRRLWGGRCRGALFNVPDPPRATFHGHAGLVETDTETAIRWLIFGGGLLQALICDRSFETEAHKMLQKKTAAEAAGKGWNWRRDPLEPLRGA